jgi:asparagine synthase (glutamine-hydrolysing)
MRQRGPDDVGTWISDDGCIGLGHTRLAINDLSLLGAQPMADVDGMVRVVFNGEIYNYPSLRRALEQRGRTFHSTSDTEVLIHLYHEYGADMVEHLQGMFAFVIWDKRSKTLLCARDHFGIKPLYYSDDGKTIRFASQVRALMQGGHISRSVDPAALVGFAVLGSVPDPFTIYSAVKAVPAGTALWVSSDGRVRSWRFFDLGAEISASEREAAPILTPGAQHEILGAALGDSVNRHLLADVPVGVFLSAGLDSASILALSTRAERKPGMHAITLGFRDYVGSRRDETIAAAAVAQHFGAPHDVAWRAQEDFQDCRKSFFEAMDQPTIDGLNMFLVSKAAADLGLKTALSGTGGDELFGGYSSVRQIPRLVTALSPFRRTSQVGRYARMALRGLASSLGLPKAASLIEYGGSYETAYLLRYGVFLPWELPDLLNPDLVRQGWADLALIDRLYQTHRQVRSPRLKIMSMETSWYLGFQLLRDSDWAGMAHGLEIRVPFVDVTLLRLLLPLISAEPALRKADLARSALSTLPSSFIRRPKTGFAVPQHEWIPSGTPATKSRSGRRAWAMHVLGEYAHNDGIPCADLFAEGVRHGRAV